MNSPSPQDHLAQLDALIAEQEADGENPWLAKAIRDRILRDLAAAAPPPTVREEIERVLLSGLTGAALFAELWRRFPDSRRADVFAAVATAITIMHADVVLAGLARAVQIPPDLREAA